MSSDNLSARLATLSPAQRKVLLERAREKSRAQAGAESPLTPIPAAERNPAALPLSPEQERLWLLEQVEHGSRLAAVAADWTLYGPLVPAALEAALVAAVVRHEALRLRFFLHAGEPHGAVVEPAVSFALLDLAALPGAAAEEEAARLAARAHEGPFDLADGRLAAARLVRLAAERHHLILAAHRIAADEAALAVLLSEVAALYGAAVTGEPAALPAPALAYADVAWHQSQRLTGERGKALSAFWSARLTPHPLPLALPWDRPRPAVRSGRGARLAAPLGVGAEALAAFAEARDVEPWLVGLAAFQALLARWSGQGDIALGWPSPGRSRPELARLVGPLADLLVLRQGVKRGQSFEELLARTKETVADALLYADLPFEKLVEELKPDHDPAVTPFVQVTFAAGPAATPPAFAGLSAAPAGGTRPAAAELDLEWTFLAGGGEEPAAEVVFALDLFDRATAGRFLAHYATLLAGALAEPSLPVASLPLLTAAERTEIEAASRPPAGAALAGSISGLIAAQAARTPGATAVIAGEDRVSYADLEARANRLAHHLVALGKVGPEKVVAVRLARTADLVVALLAALKTGSAYLPIDPKFPGDRVSFLLKDTGAGVLVTRTDLPRPEGVRQKLTEVLLDTDAAEIAARPAEPLPKLADPGPFLAYLIYTSGSTGRPKGVAITHGSAVELLAWMQVDYSPAELAGVLGSTSVNFDLSIFEIFGTLAAGGTLILADHALAYPALPAAGEVTLINSVPSAMAALLDLGPLPASVKTVNLAGEPLRRALADRIYAAGVERLWNLYGPSEDTTYSTGTIVAPGAAAEPDIGRPLAGSLGLVFDTDLNLQPVGVPGELCLAGTGLARGYFRRPALTAEKFVPDPASGISGGRLYKTGDLARLRPDGAFEYLGRLDTQVKVRGFRIELGEVEAALAAHPDLRECAVVLAEDPAGDRQLAACVVSLAGRAADVAALRNFLRGKLPEYMVPTQWNVLAELPQTSTGKIDRAALAKLAAPGETAEREVLPRNEIEEAIAEAWKQVLRRDQVGISDNFFDIGGHSLLVVKIHSLLAPRFPNLVVLDLFRHPTVSALASFLAAQAAQGSAMPAAAAAAAADEETGEARAPFAGTGSVGSGGVAIVGMAGRFPGAADVETFWRNLLDGVESIARLPEPAPGAEAPGYVPAASVLEGIDLFDAGLFGFAPREAEATDPQHRLFLETAWAALENAGYDPGAFRGPAGIGVFAGAGANSYLANLYSHPEVLEALGPMRSTIAADKDYLATRVSYKLGLGGPSLTVQSACSTSLVAVHLACRSLLAGECDLAIAGGASVHNFGGHGYTFEEGGIFSPDGHCRSFDAAARGTVPGSGVAAVVLKRVEEALADGDTIVAVIRGSAINNDGADKIGYTAPGVEGQARVIRAAHRNAGIDAATIGYVEAHGTATPLGDPIEVAALAQAFAPARERRTFPVLLGSVKSNVGHLDTAAGVTGLIKTALAVSAGVVPPSLHYEKPNPDIDFAAGPFEVAATARPLPQAPGEPRRAGVSSFGIGGTNAHVLVEQAPESAPGDPASPWQLYLLSGRSAEGLDRASANLAAHLERHPDLDPADVAHTLRVGRRGFEHRRAVVAGSLEEARLALAARDERVQTGVAPGISAAAFLFPGQGAQQVGMGRDLYATQPVFRAEIDRAAGLLQPHLGLDLRELLYPEGEAAAEVAAARLGDTRFTQPALFAVEYALARLWMSWGVVPTAYLGHSVGEYVAACLAGVFSLEDALALIALRGRLVSELPAGAMLSVPLPEAELELPEGLSVAVQNAPDRTVVAGPIAAIEAWEKELAGRGLDVRRLAASHAFHSAMMEPAVAPLVEAVAKVERRAPRIPYLSNLTGTWIRAEEATDPAYWGRHLRQPVRFAEGLKELLAGGRAGVAIEVGPGETLVRLARKQAREGGASLTAVSTLPSAQAAASPSEEAHLLRSVGRLWLAGVPFDWRGFQGEARRKRVPLPTYPFARERYWLEPRAFEVGGASAPTPAAKVTATGRRRDPADWFYLPSFKRSLPPAPAEPAGGGRLLFFAEASAVSSALAARLRAAGFALTVVHEGKLFARQGDGSYSIRPAEAGDYASLLAEVGTDLAGAVHLWSFGASRPVRLDDLDAALGHGPASLLLLGRALARRESPAPFSLRVVSSYLHDLGGSETVHPERAAILGLSRTLPLEIPGLTVQSLDLLPAENGEKTVVDRILAEMAAAPADPVVAYRGRQRWVQQLEPVRLEAAEPQVRPGGVYLVTGGLTGIGYEIARTLAVHGTRLALVGRTVLPVREEWPDDPAVLEDEEARILLVRARELEALGAEVMTLTADVSRRYQMERVREQVRGRWKTVHGVVHALGLPGGQPLVEEDGAAAVQALATKARGTLVLAEIFPPRELDFLLLCSSLGAVVGAPGEAALAAADAFVDAFAAAHQGRGDLSTGWVSSVGWDRLGEAGDPTALSPREAADAFGRILARSSLPHLLVSVRPIEAVHAPVEPETAEEEQPQAAPAPETGRHRRPELATAYTAPGSEIEERLATIWADLLGLEQVGIHDDFFELGGDSVLGLRIAARAREHGYVLEPGRIFEKPTIASLAAALADGGETAAEAAAEMSEPAQATEPAGPEAAPKPEDFPDADISQRDLDTLLSQLGGRG